VGVSNQGVGPAISSGWADRLELWTAPGFPGSSWYSLISQSQHSEVVPVGGCYWLTNTLAIPDGGGQFSLVFRTDAWNNFYEANETNNQVSSPLTLMIPPGLEGGGLAANGTFWSYAAGTVGFKYTFEASSDLVNWVALSTLEYYPGMIVEESAAAGHPQRFYRLVLAQPAP
jgi:hypothetical protein